MQGIDVRTILIICIGIIFLVSMTIFLVIKLSRQKVDPFENMDGNDFEKYCANILKHKGFDDIELTPASRDYGIDIFAKKDGITYAIQCKCYSDTVGIKAVQEAYSGKDYYDKMIAAVMTNQYYSKPAIEFSQKLNVVLWDRDFLEDYRDESV